MRRLVLGLLALLGIATCGIVAVWTVEARPAPTPDVAALNDAVHLAQAAWPEVAASTFARVREPLTVVDVTDRVLASTSSSAPTSRFDAAQQRALVAPVVVDGRVVGMVYLLDAVAANEAASRGDVAIAATVAIAAATLGVAGVALSQLTNVGPNLGQSYIVDSFMVVVFGGVGNLWGTLVAGLSLGVANKLLEPWSGAVLAKILVLVFLVLFIQKRPRGLFPQRGRAAEV